MLPCTFSFLLGLIEDETKLLGHWAKELILMVAVCVYVCVCVCLCVFTSFQLKASAD